VFVNQYAISSHSLQCGVEIFLFCADFAVHILDLLVFDVISNLGNITRVNSSNVAWVFLLQKSLSKYTKIEIHLTL
jgi:hypothetical protein